MVVAVHRVDPHVHLDQQVAERAAVAPSPPVVRARRPAAAREVVARRRPDGATLDRGATPHRVVATAPRVAVERDSGVAAHSVAPAAVRVQRIGVVGQHRSSRAGSVASRSKVVTPFVSCCSPAHAVPTRC